MAVLAVTFASYPSDCKRSRASFLGLSAKHWHRSSARKTLAPLLGLLGLAIKWQLLDDFRSIAKPGVADTHVPRPPTGEHVLFWAGKILFFGLALGLPMFFHPWLRVVAFFLLTDAILGLLLSVVFQLAHCLGEAKFAAPPLPGRAMDCDWATHQVESTVDFARHNRPLTWFIGGLNFQIEHHLFPRVCHAHYPALSKIVERVCLKHGVRYMAHATAGKALRSHYQWLRLLGRA